VCAKSNDVENPITACKQSKTKDGQTIYYKVRPPVQRDEHDKCNAVNHMRIVIFPLLSYWTSVIAHTHTHAHTFLPLPFFPPLENNNTKTGGQHVPHGQAPPGAHR
jgi:hypothetical protein